MSHIEQNDSQAKYGLAGDVKTQIGSTKSPKNVRREEFVTYAAWKQIHGSKENQ